MNAIVVGRAGFAAGPAKPGEVWGVRLKGCGEQRALWKRSKKAAWLSAVELERPPQPGDSTRVRFEGRVGSGVDITRRFPTPRLQINPVRKEVLFCRRR